MACNDCSSATDLFNFVKSIIAISKLSTLRLHFAHLRFAEPQRTNTGQVSACSQEPVDSTDANVVETSTCLKTIR